MRNLTGRLVTTGLALLLAAGPATGLSQDPASAALSEARAAAARMQERAAAIRADLTSGSYVRAVRRLALMAGLPAPSPAALGNRTELRTLPPTVRGPVADLLAATLRAAGGMRRALTADDGRSLRLAARADRLGHRISLALAKGERWPVAAARRLKAQVTASPVLRAAATGGATIAAALDRSLGALRAAAAGLPRASGRVAACDVLDQRPHLCVGGTGPNATDAEAALVVDLGGDDTYTSSAGGANSARCVDDPDDVSCNASLLVDLGGNDRYDVSNAISHDHLVAVGSALTGVGILVDAGGNDAYVAAVPDRSRSLDISFVFGSADMGLGLLADLTGDDRYEMTGAPDDFFNPYTHGASLTGMGALLDLDGANTYRIVESGTQTPNPESPLAANDFANSQAVGIFGAGALVDRTGYATLEVRIEATAGGQKDMNIVNPIAQGVGLIGDAALFTGEGPTTFSAIARRVASATLPGQSAEPEPDENGFVPPVARVPGGAYTTAQGVGAIGFAVIEDMGGDDTYETLARSEHHLTVTAESGCSCDRAIATLDVSGWDDFFGGPFDAAGAGVSTQGVGSSIFVPDAGVLIHDAAGDDLYTARAELVISSTAKNALPGGGAGARAEAVPYQFPAINAFGQGLGSDFSPTVLLDDGGDDTYELVTHAITDARADAGQGPASARAYGGLTSTYGQGASYFDPAQGALLDLGGRDAYATHSISRTTTTPDPGAHDAKRAIGAQGAVGGILADLDAGLVDSFTATPEPGPGVGARGEGPGWVDIVNLFPGYGLAPLQPAKQPTALAMDPANPAQAPGGYLPFRARLTQDGQPLSGGEVTFDIEYRYADIAMQERWSPHRFRAHGITDADGWASGFLDLDEFVAYFGGAEYNPDDWTLRIAARYHGDPSLRPALATQPFRIAE